MCGIVGIYGFQGLEGVSSASLDCATDKLQRRGPDARGTYIDHRVGFGHRRLSIIDLDARGTQPMWDATGRYCIVFNGEVYNYQSLKSELSEFQFKSSTDTEVILNAYVKWGVDCLERFNGFFALAIYDKEEASVFVARDRFGIKPLVYAQNENHFAFGSEIKALKELHPCNELNHVALNLYFQLTYIPAPYSIYKDVHKLEAGHYLMIRDRSVVKKKYYELTIAEHHINDYGEAKSQIRELMIDSVSSRLVADVPVGTFLSGGIDSSIITALAAKEKKGLSSFSIGFKDNPFFDETKYAETLARAFDTNHHTFTLSNDDLYEQLHHVVDYFDEPFADSSALPVQILSRLTRAHVTVALSGDGADEVFSGYNKHAAWVNSRDNKFTNAIIVLLGEVIKLLPQSRNGKLSNMARQMVKYHDILLMNPEDRYWRLATFIREHHVERLLKHPAGLHEFKKRLEMYSMTIDDVLLKDIELVLQGDMLTKVDWMSMSNSLEVRVPFLDHRLVEAAFSLPEHFKIAGGVRKKILREAFEEELPDGLQQRKKHGFEVPLLDWFRGELKGELDQVVFNRELIASTNLFNWESVDMIRKRLHSGNPGDAHIQVWQLYVFMKWWGRF
ncbi:MAG: asparagine synthase (glutamine-hydrolyzing) [Cyclobacteriaceae bacterium]